MKKNILILLVLCGFLVSCEDLFEPAAENILKKEQMYPEPNFAEGLLAAAYAQMPGNGLSFNEVATDDAVSNKNDNDYRKVAGGRWASSNETMSRWTSCYSAILYLNAIIEEGDEVKWAEDEVANKLFNLRIKGEAHGLRALFMYYLLQAHGGMVDGKLLGIPLILTQQDPKSDFNLPRASLEATVAQIYADLDEAEKYLPFAYDDCAEKVPTEYAVQYGVSDTIVTTFNRTMGGKFRGRLNRLIVKAIRAQVALLVASPAFLNGADDSWENAAKYASEVIRLNPNGALAGDGITWYKNTTEIESLDSGKNPAEIIWRSSVGDNKTHETDHYPPSLYGKGNCNPTQNLVDAFPMANGYPISDKANSAYDKNNPYEGRDPRLSKYVVFNGSTFGPIGSSISITSGKSDDVMNKEPQKSTRTGYYLRKFMKEETNLTTDAAVTKKGYYARLRWTEIYLIYAEAANEAYGPDGKPEGAELSARQVIGEIRKRAGVGARSDRYLNEVITDKDMMRELIQNERRLELCFEGHRFWDLRRWKKDLNEPARGIGITNEKVDLGEDGKGVVVESRNYKEYMYYGPIPLSETLKWSNLKQNTGW